MSPRYFACRKCGGNIVEAVDQVEKLFDEAETVIKLTYVCDRVNACG